MAWHGDEAARRAMAGTVGGLAGGVLVSAMMQLKTILTGRPHDLVQLRRRWSGSRIPGRMQGRAGVAEEMAAHGGHLALSAASGALYGVLRPSGASPVVSGLVFGAGFMGIAFGIVGPGLDVAPPLWRDSAASNGQHVLVHALFGMATALVTERALRRIATPRHRTPRR